MPTFFFGFTFSSAHVRPEKWTHKYFPCVFMHYCLTRVPFTKVKSNINQVFMKLLPGMVHPTKMKMAFLLPCVRIILAHDLMKYTNEARYASTTRYTVAKLLLFLALLQYLLVFPQIHHGSPRVSRFTHSPWMLYIWILYEREKMWKNHSLVLCDARISTYHLPQTVSVSRGNWSVKYLTYT